MEKKYRTITFFYSNNVEKKTAEPIAEEALRRGYKVRFTDVLQEEADIGFYCQHLCFPENSIRKEISCLWVQQEIHLEKCILICPARIIFIWQGIWEALLVLAWERQRQVGALLYVEEMHSL